MVTGFLIYIVFLIYAAIGALVLHSRSKRTPGGCGLQLLGFIVYHSGRASFLKPLKKENSRLFFFRRDWY
jgi:hypothetical protein